MKNTEPAGRTALTPMQRARKKYEETHKKERKQTNGQFTTSVPREMYDEINEFLEKHKVTKVQLIFEGYESLKKQLAAIGKK